MAFISLGYGLIECTYTFCSSDNVCPRPFTTKAGRVRPHHVGHTLCGQMSVRVCSLFIIYAYMLSYAVTNTVLVCTHTFMKFIHFVVFVSRFVLVARLVLLLFDALRLMRARSTVVAPVVCG